MKIRKSPPAVHEEYGADELMSIGSLQMIVKSKGRPGLTRVLKVLAGAGRAPITALELKATFYAIYSLGADDKKLRAAIETESSDDWIEIGSRLMAETGINRLKALAQHWVDLTGSKEAKPTREQMLVARQKENNARRKAA